ncbi:hypothetical protein LX36DRAFT_84259 [Colletotrichum falcatum]|nr:hypothetical protein LX36DRAFT_84259 [Colletotrichum falcatum]
MICDSWPGKDAAPMFRPYGTEFGASVVIVIMLLMRVHGSALVCWLWPCCEPLRLSEAVDIYCCLNNGKGKGTKELSSNPDRSELPGPQYPQLF